MAEAGFSQFRCPVCLEQLKDPVTIPCGHSYCMNCITHHWNQEDQKGLYSCPQCRQTFSPKPALNKNMLADEIELKNTELNAEDVKCDVCGRNRKAVKSCLDCMKSFCQDHLEQHETLFEERTHNLIDPTEQLKDMICVTHNHPLDIYCRTDHQCICICCTVDKHRRHNFVSAATERADIMTNVLGVAQGKYQQLIHSREEYLRELKEAVEKHKHSAQMAVEDSERIFPELIRFIQTRCDEITPMIRAREKIVVSQAEGLMKQLKQEIDDLKGRNAKLDQLSYTHNHTYFLQKFPSRCNHPQLPDIPSITDSSFVKVRKSVSELRQKLEAICRKDIEQISGQVTCIQIIPTPEYESRKDFLNYFQPFTLDPNTAHQRLHLCKNKRMVTYTSVFQIPDNLERFSYWWQVLGRECVHGRCYWEVEWSGSGKGSVGISVSYKSISRKGWSNECKFGGNNQSWSLICSPSRCTFWHNNNHTDLPVVCSSSKIGVYVDPSAGIMSFYSVSDKMSLIHRIQTTFTQPLYPGFGINFLRLLKLVKYPVVKLCDITI